MSIIVEHPKTIGDLKRIISSMPNDLAIVVWDPSAGDEWPAEIVMVPIAYDDGPEYDKVIVRGEGWE